MILGWTLPILGLCQTGDGNALLGKCTHALRVIDNRYRMTSTEDVANYEWCRGYVLGWVEGYETGTLQCTPEKITDAQLVRIVVKYLRDYPQMLGVATHGFAWVRVTAKRLALRFYDVQQTVLYAWEMAATVP